MFKVAIKKINKAPQITTNLQKLAHTDVLVGIPQEKSSRRGDALTNAELGFIQSYGSPVNNIPPRPFLQPSIEANRDKIAKQQQKIITAALEGKNPEPEFEKLGLMAQGFVKGWFKNPENRWPPNKPETIARKGSDRPLIDTGQLLNSISYVVSSKDSNK